LHDYKDQVYKMLAQDPVTPSEVAKSLGISYKTAQRVLLELAATKGNVAYRKSGRIYLFWCRENPDDKQE
jgi:predicted ArsR family transcriptional regulator